MEIKLNKKDLVKELVRIRNLAVLMNESHEKYVRSRSYMALIESADSLIEKIEKSEKST